MKKEVLVAKTKKKTNYALSILIGIAVGFLLLIFFGILSSSNSPDQKFNNQLLKIQSHIPYQNQLTDEWNLNLGRRGSEQATQAEHIRNEYFVSCTEMRKDIEISVAWTKANDYALTPSRRTEINNWSQNALKRCDDNLAIMDREINSQQFLSLAPSLLTALI